MAPFALALLTVCQLTACAEEDRTPAHSPPGPALVAAAATSDRLRTSAPQNPIEIQRVWLAVGVTGEEPGDGELRVTLGTQAEVHVVVEGRASGTRKTRLFADTDVIRRGRRRLAAEAWPKDAGKLEITLFRLEADPVDNAIYDNTGSMEHYWLPELRKDHPSKWHWCPIDYVTTDTGWGSVWRHTIDATATTTGDYKGLGTMRFVAKIVYRGQTYWTPGVEHKDAAGLLPGLPTLRVRRDDTDVGYMTELINVPYVFGSSSHGGTHQADRAVGADCADLIVYGWRRAGHDIDYTWTQGLKSITRSIAVIPSQVDGVYQTADGRTLRFGVDVQVGDIVLWRRHVGVIAGKDPSGVFSLNTPVLHTVVESPELETMADVGFGFSAGDFEVRRPKWADKAKRRARHR